MKSINDVKLKYFVDKIKSLFSLKDHTHKYAGSSTVGGSASSAEKLLTPRNIAVDIGSNTSGMFDGSSDITCGINVNKSGLENFFKRCHYIGLPICLSAMMYTVINPADKDTWYKYIGASFPPQILIIALSDGDLVLDPSIQSPLILVRGVSRFYSRTGSNEVIGSVVWGEDDDYSVTIDFGDLNTPYNLKNKRYSVIALGGLES